MARLEIAAKRHQTTLQGRRTVWREWGEGSPLVMLHGGFGSWTHFLRVIPEVARRFRVLCPDMPGFGDSDDPICDDLPAAVSLSLREGLRTLLGPGQRFDLVGFSLGTVMSGALTALLARAPQEPRPRRLVLFAPAGIRMQGKEIQGLLGLNDGMTAAERHAVHRHNLGLLMFSDSCLVDEDAVLLQDSNVAATRPYARRHSGSDILLRALEDRPVEAVAAAWGTRDAFIAPRLEKYEARVAKLYPGIVLKRLPGVGHWAPYQAPDASTNLILDFLARDMTR